MIAVVSSTISPSPLPSHDGARTTLSPETRLEHTQETIASLVALGIRQIFIADNSAGSWLRKRANELAPATVLHFDQPPIRNKGIGEMWLLLGSLEFIPENESILKISGRYRIGPETELKLRDGDDLAGKIYTQGRMRSLSTRCYVLRDRTVATRLWERTMDEIYGDLAHIRGPRSLLRLIKNSIHPSGDHLRYGDPPTAVENAIYRATRRLSLRLNPVGNLAVQGILGSWTNPEVRE